MEEAFESTASRASSETVRDLSDSEQPLKHTRSKKRKCVQLQQAFPWLLSGFMLFALILQHWRHQSRQCVPVGYWGSSDLEIAQREVPERTLQVQFSGGLKWDETSHLIREIDPTIPDYGGIPTPEIDAAWQELISTTDIFLTREEVDEIISNDGAFARVPSNAHLYTDPYTGLYQAVPAVFHNLHCLDIIRRGVYIQYYPEELTPAFKPHIQHCIDSIRQSLMCEADMTPIPEIHTTFRPNGGLEPVFQVEHTCRDFNAMQKWAKQRDALDEALWRDNAQRLKPGVFANP
ncbi:hypothetical protein A1O7_05508 [Cladophialophora yegresii CBS 114405]|uniref:DUF3328 domain-containing protein n=1 Tax=Cladophialophora yegresii CBS 114405 TaxID=1182544 RepID=W9WHV4_9EURO|nr:uncharacterized protein A1O7_05508 [Cladophialophora yegresii CBS 114405]EXJ58084.1 hypothetical protein A1O7_05508 [Cladophialophora yegresii CBS 114405]